MIEKKESDRRLVSSIFQEETVSQNSQKEETRSKANFLAEIARHFEKEILLIEKKETFQTEKEKEEEKVLLMQDWFFYSSFSCFQALEERISLIKKEKQIDEKKILPYEEMVSEFNKWKLIEEDILLLRAILLFCPEPRPSKERAETKKEKNLREIFIRVNFWEEYWKIESQNKNLSKEESLCTKIERVFEKCGKKENAADVINFIEDFYVKQKERNRENAEIFWKSTELEVFLPQAKYFLKWWKENKRYFSETDNKNEMEEEKEETTNDIFEESFNDSNDDFRASESCSSDKTFDTTIDDSFDSQATNDSISDEKKIELTEWDRKVKIGLTILAALLIFVVISAIFSWIKGNKEKSKEKETSFSD